MPVRHARFVRTPAQPHFPPVDQGGKVHDAKLPVAQFDSDIFDLFQAYADLVGGEDQFVACVFDLTETPGGLKGLDSLVYFQ